MYFYWLDANFGLMYVRLQTWFPYTIQVYVNGHHWLAQQRSHWGMGFVQQENAFVALDDAEGAQTLADRFAKLGWVKQRTAWARQVNAVLSGEHLLRGFRNREIRQALWGESKNACLSFPCRFAGFQPG